MFKALIYKYSLLNVFLPLKMSSNVLTSFDHELLRPGGRAIMGSGKN